MERKIGEIFEYNGEWYQCIGDDNKSCTSCDMNFDGKCPISMAECDGSLRSDNSDVCFKRLEKVGEPYTDYYPSGRVIYFQRYKCYQKPIYNGDFICWSDDISISIEIKNKEDMEEKKPTYEELLHYYHSTVGLWAIDRSPQEVSLDWIRDNAFQLGIDEKHSNSESIGKNLKAFDLQAAKSGKPVCTRDRRKARIICFDVKGDICPIIALVEKDDIEATYHYNENGQNAYNKSELDLMMFPEKKEGWVNIDKGGSGKIIISSPYSTKEEAIRNDNECTIDTIKVSWEE